MLTKKIHKEMQDCEMWKEKESILKTGRAKVGRKLACSEAL